MLAKHVKTAAGNSTGFQVKPADIPVFQPVVRFFYFPVSRGDVTSCSHHEVPTRAAGQCFWPALENDLEGGAEKSLG
jgi:hypothetical protein